MKIRNILFTVISLSLFLSGCNEYKSYTKTVQVTLIAETEYVSDGDEEIVKEDIDREIATESDLYSIWETEAGTTETDVRNTENVEHKIYYTKSGKSYHYSNPCGRGTYYECTLDEAIEMGLKPCKKCVE